MVRLFAFVCVAWLCAVASAPARAAWLEAETAHFVIDADTTEAKIRAFATRLERFDAAMRTLYAIPEDAAPRSHRVHIYAVGQGSVPRYCKGCPSTTAGFYRGDVSGALIFTATLGGSDGKDLMLDSQEILLHEYSHHLMLANFAGVYPMWFTEGFAELNANVHFQPDGSIVVGTPANYRAFALRLGTPIPIRSLIAPTRNDVRDPDRLEQIYGRGWLLTHYLMLNIERRAQLGRYQRLLDEGKSSVDAATEAFGDLAKLDHALNVYVDTHLPALMIPAGSAPEVKVMPLSPGMAAIMPVHLRFVGGVDDDQAHALILDAEHRATPYPQDARVQDALAEAEFAANRDNATDAAVDRALAADPNDITAMLYKGRVVARRLARIGSHDDKDWAAARRWFVKANRADTEAAWPLVLYYQSYLAEGASPPEIAERGLFKAHLLAPQDDDLRWLVAARLLEDKEIDATRAALRPIAFSPHPKKGANKAQDVIDLLNAGRIDDARRLLSGPPEDKDDASK